LMDVNTLSAGPNLTPINARSSRPVIVQTGAA
jgi:hypothetical protein